MNKTPSANELTGLAAAPGAVEGSVCVLRSGTDAEIPRGAILVLRILHPHLTPVVTRVRGLVVEEGALLQHATIVAREFGIPAVVGVADATLLLRNGEQVRVDGDAGVVHRLDVNSGEGQEV